MNRNERFYATFSLRSFPHNFYVTTFLPPTSRFHPTMMVLVCLFDLLPPSLLAAPDQTQSMAHLTTCLHLINLVSGNIGAKGYEKLGIISQTHHYPQIYSTTSCNPFVLLNLQY